jgi:hypothetical protein
MPHGVSVRTARAAPILLSIALCASCADPRTAGPTPESPLQAGSERCSPDGGPIEILAADVVVAIDRSGSTREPTGIDIDGDGTIGEFRHSDYTDQGDSMLAAELVAVGRLIEVARLGGMRFAIVSYSGRSDFPLYDPVSQHVDYRDARLETELTDDPTALETAVARVASRGPNGASSFAPAMRLAVRSLAQAPESDTARRRRVLFLSDSAMPVRYAPMERIARDDARMEKAARLAIASGISFHSFALGEASAAGSEHALAQIAGATGGTYRAVPDPRSLYCQLLAALGARDPRPPMR